ncbi:MAG: HD domain-containing protein, partial [Proteobacteria bacterium]|nr:HD domain-containing protein [Pseudomonadota bacterium]
AMDKDYISMLYLYDSSPAADLRVFSKPNGFILYECNDFSSGKDAILSRKPALILIEATPDWTPDFLTAFQDILTAAVSINASVFGVFQDLPDASMRARLFEMGLNEILISPFLIQEVKEKFKVYDRVGDLIQKDAVRKKEFKKNIDDLNRSKDELKKTQESLSEEIVLLNSALKQIHQMTKERSRLNEKISGIQEKLADNIQGFYENFCQLVEIRAEKNRGHGARVAHIANFLGKQFEFDDKKLDDLEKAAMLHEIGLLFIPEEVLQKKEGQLTEYEKGLFAQYPVKGADLLSRCSEFENVAQIIRGLNENSDGTGTPDGLKRRYIPLAARILAGADVFDRLKDHKGMNRLDKLLERLEEFSGNRLDPGIVSRLEKYAVLHMGTADYHVRGVGIHQLEPGMTLGTALFTNSGTKLFSVNTLLTLDAIDKIKKYNREYPVDETVYIRA